MKNRKAWWRRARSWRWLQIITGVHRVHHIRYGFGWTAPFSRTLVRFEDQRRLPGWSRVSPAQYHDSTQTGSY